MRLAQNNQKSASAAEDFTLGPCKVKSKIQIDIQPGEYQEAEGKQRRIFNHI